MSQANLRSLLFIVRNLIVCQNVKQADVGNQCILALLNVLGIGRVHIFDLNVLLVQQVVVPSAKKIINQKYTYLTLSN